MEFIENENIDLSKYLFSSIPTYHNINPLYDQEGGLTLNSLLIHKHNYHEYFREAKELIIQMVCTIKTITTILTNTVPRMGNQHHHMQRILELSPKHCKILGKLLKNGL